jgi:hypothetical protein
VDEMRVMCATLAEQRYTRESMQPWLIHWDHQLAKAMTHQFQLGLESLNENLAELKVRE